MDIIGGLPVSCSRTLQSRFAQNKSIGDDTKAAVRRNPKCNRKKIKNTAKNDFQYGGRSPS